ncbi:MAG: GntR family transcriptional regulator, partial [Pirellulaceae bacterium]|nr:GntR family transcriptional regulator [Pirellulaceae bacterium]
FQGRLSAGQHLVISDLSKRLGVSSTPVREALVALEGIGIVDSIPNRGAVVRQVTRADVREVCQVRRSLECEAGQGLASIPLALNETPGEYTVTVRDAMTGLVETATVDVIR